jgi:hypothetical protein
VILGRSANLFLGLATAGVGLVWGIAAQMGQPLSPELAGLVIAFLGAVIAVIAGNDNLAVQKGQAAAARIAAKK